MNLSKFHLSFWFLLFFLNVYNLNAQTTNEYKKKRTKKAKTVTPKSDTPDNGSKNAPKPSALPVKSAKDAVIKGKIIDGETGEPLIGATVTLKNTNAGANTDVDGLFHLTIPANTEAVLQVSYVGYQTLELTGFDLNSSQTLSFSLQPEAVELKTVVVQATVAQSSDAAAQLQQMKNMGISDVFSGETVLKVSSDLNIGVALSRMPGVTLIEDRYLVIRGLYERYNVMLLNGGILPTLSTERQSFDFANVPSNMLASLSLIKSGQADKIGSYAGGLINIETPNMPDKRKFSVNYQTIFNSQTSFRTTQKYATEGGLGGFLGKVQPFAPDNLPTSAQIQAMNPTSDEAIAAAKLLNSNVVPQNRFTPPGQNLSIRYDDVYAIGQAKLGYVSGINLWDLTEFEDRQYNVVRSYDSTLGRSPVTDEGLYKTYISRQGLNAYLNACYQTPKSKISWYNWFSQTQENMVTTNIGRYVVDPVTHAEANYFFQPMRFLRNTLYTTQLKGVHTLSANKKDNGLRLEWLTFMNVSRSIDPAYRAMNYLREDSSKVYYYDTTLVDDYQVFEDAFSSTQNDFEIGGDAHIIVPVKIKERTLKLEGGAFFYRRQRSFDSRLTALYPNHDNFKIPLEQTSFANLPTLFNKDNIRPDGFLIRDATTDSNRYSARSLNLAFYAMGEMQIFDRFNVQAGLRVEHQNQFVANKLIANDELHTVTDNNQLDFLPSVNLKYELTPKMNLKASFYTSVSRPELRELSTFRFYNFNTVIYWVGNPQLKRTYISSVDLRWEWFMGGLDNLSFTLFYKHFNNPIEQYISEGSVEVIQEYSLTNRQKSAAAGLEIEARKNFGFVGRRFFENLTLYANLSLLKSRVNSDLTNVFSSGRSLQGQSPYLFNTGLFYIDKKLGFGVALFYSRSGQRISVVGTGDTSFPNIYELGRDVFDIQVSKRFGKGFELKFALQDLLNQPIRSVQIYGGGSSFDPNRDQVINNVKRGQKAVLSLTYHF